MSFAVVEFSPTKVDAGGLALVSSKWFTPLKKECFWPPLKDQDKFVAAVKQGKSVDETTWALFPVKRIFCESDDYDRIHRKMRKAEMSSNLESEDSEIEIPKRVPKKNKKYVDSSSDEDIHVSNMGGRNHPKPPPIKFRKTGKTSSSLESPSCSNSTRIKSFDEWRFNQSSSGLSDQRTTRNSNDINLNIDIATKLLREVIAVKEQNKEILELLRANKQGPINIIPDLPVTLPIRNDTDLNELETYLSDNPCVVNGMIMHFSGDTSEPVYVTNRILRHLLTDAVASYYSFFGSRNGKKAFSSLKLNHIVIESVLSNKSVSRQKVESFIKIWLKNAPSRETKSREKNLKLI